MLANLAQPNGRDTVVLGLPNTDTLPSIRQKFAVYVSGGAVNIDDRAKVIKVQNGVQSGADILQSSTYTVLANRIGVEAVTGKIVAKDKVYLSDRSQVGDVTSTSYVVRGSSVVAGNIVQGTYVHPEGIALSAPAFTPGRPNQEVQGKLTVQLQPGVYGDVTVRNLGTLSLVRGLYQFNSLTVNAGGIVRRDDTDDNAKTWLFVYSDSAPDIQGPLYASAGTVLFAAPNSNYVFINQQFNATIVAPKADVNADLSSAHASLVGSVFAKSLTFHQGSVLGWVPFTSNWTPTCSSGNTNCN